MKEFLVGLLFLLVAGVFVGIWFLLSPLLLVLGVLLRLGLMFAFVIVAIWLIGKFIMMLWEKIKG